MNRQQQQGLLLAGLIVVMLVVYARAWHPAPRVQVDQRDRTEQARAPSLTQPASQEEAVAALPVPEPSSQRDAQHQRAAQLAWGRDPFTHGAAAGDDSGLTLAGILWDPQQPLAIINGQTVQVGAELDGYHITEISPDRVSLTDGTQTFQLQITP